MLFLVVLTVSLATVECASPGSFFWKPRLALVMALPTTKPPVAQTPNKENIGEGTVVFIDGYRLAVTVAVLAESVKVIRRFPQYDVSSAYFYTNAYRWALRYLSLIPDWLGGGGKGIHYANTHRVWKRRFHYMDAFIPKWFRPVLPFVKKSEWEREEKEYKGYLKFANHYFKELYQYPSEKFANFASQNVQDKSNTVSTSEMSCFDC